MPRNKNLQQNYLLKVFVYLILFLSYDAANPTVGKNSHGASFSPGGEWIPFIAYTDVANRNQASYEIYIMRVDGTGLRQLTDNSYWVYQSRWGSSMFGS